MNEFLEQFLLESRELVQQASDDLLALEQAPADTERFNSAFRAFHTLKGGAGIVEFPAMERALHAAEDALTAVRSGSQAVSSQLVGDCLACLDQIARWLDIVERSGEIPADADSDAIVAHFGRSEAKHSQTTSTSAEDWQQALLQRYASVRSRAKAAVRYVPAADCFFRGEDPIARIAALPGLLSLDLMPASAWPLLDELDPFACNVVVGALTEASLHDVVAALGEAIDQCDVRAVSSVDEGDGGGALPQQARALLREQLLLLDEKGAHGASGRIGSAGIVAANVLRHLGRTQDADRMATATAHSVDHAAPAFLREAIEASIGGTAPRSAQPISASSAPAAMAQTLRVDASRIDALVNLTGELTVAKNAIGHAVKLAQDANDSVARVLKERHAVLDRLLGALQRSVLEIRVLPLRHVFQRFPRLMREVAAELGKPTNLVVEGADTEADKSIVETLFEPLLHVLRNAVDHGIESEARRAAAGKPRVASIVLRAFSQGEHVVVEVIDDGGGIDIEKVRQVALDRGVVSHDVLAAMSETETIDLIFAPGFSTAAEVTGLSGRGVGMDAVRSAVERLMGKVEIESRPGRGTTVRFTLPFSVMLTRVMTVEVAGQLFGIAFDAIIETIRIGRETITSIGAAQAIVVRDRTVPLVELAQALGLQRDRPEPAEATVIVAEINGDVGALQVDRLGERLEIMLKPLGGLLSGTPSIAGSALLGDGSVLLVLDLGELLR